MDTAVVSHIHNYIPANNPLRIKLLIENDTTDCVAIAFV